MKYHEMSINFSHPKLYQPKDEKSLSEFHVTIENQLIHMKLKEFRAYLEISKAIANSRRAFGLKLYSLLKNQLFSN